MAYRWNHANLKTTAEGGWHVHVCLNIHVHVHADSHGAVMFLNRQQINLKKNNTESAHFLGIDKTCSRKKMKKHLWKNTEQAAPETLHPPTYIKKI